MELRIRRVDNGWVVFDGRIMKELVFTDAKSLRDYVYEWMEAIENG